jgi:tetratricopeptide (TPR) repeat protein
VDDKFTGNSSYLLQRNDARSTEACAQIMEDICEPLEPGRDRNLTLANSYHLRGRLLHILGKGAKINSAEDSYELEKKAVALRDGLEDPDIYDVAASWGQLAIWAMAAKDYEQSLDYSKTCLDTRLKYFPGEEVENLSVTYQNLGHCLQFLGRFDEAEEAIRESLAVIEMKFGNDANSVAQYVLSL